MKMPRSMLYWMSMPDSLQVGMSFQDMSVVILSVIATRSPPKTQSGRSAPEPQCAGALGGGEIFLGARIGGARIDPENEIVERQHGDRGQILPTERDAGRERRREHGGGR